jgi:hypothetical protein
LPSKIEDVVDWPLKFVGWHVRIVDLTVLELANVRVVVLVKNSEGYNFCHIPKMGYFCHKVKVLFAKQKLILPVFLVF